MFLVPLQQLRMLLNCKLRHPGIPFWLFALP